MAAGGLSYDVQWLNNKQYKNCSNREKKYETWQIDTLRYMQFNIKLWPKSIKKKLFKMAAKMNAGGLLYDAQEI